jgi:ribosomal protein L37AE/L43A
VIPLNIYRGCYYSGKCTFCDINSGYDTHYEIEELKFAKPICKRFRKLDLVIEDIKILRQKYNTQFFSFTDEWFLGGHMREFSEKLQQEGLVGREDGQDIQWEAYARFEPLFLKREICRKIAKGGCRFLQFGLESISIETLRRMRKGNRPAHYHNILENCQRTGIWTHVFLILGYPGEPLHDVLPLFDFINMHNDLITTIKPSRFQLTRRSPLVYNLPPEIEALPPEEEWELHINLPFQYKSQYWCPQCPSLDVDHIISRGIWKCSYCGSLLEKRYPYGSHKVVEAMYTVAEKICEMHKYHRVTSVYPYVTRMFLSTEELQAFSQDAEPVHIVRDNDLRKALRKVRNALYREQEMLSGIGQVYRISGLRIPDEFDSIDTFLKFCSNYTHAASGSE